MDVLLFGGTTEGSALAVWAAERGWAVTLCVATEYGARMAPDCPGVAVHTGRLDRAGMEDLMQSRPFRCVVDATHPYAAAVTANVRAAAEAVGLDYLRLLRRSDGEDGCRKAENMAAAAGLLGELPGNVLLTTGSKELAPFAAPGLVERCYPRVLPTLDSLSHCLELGFPPAHILCMQGPFSQELNTALIRQYDIKVLVTKDSGGYGGFRAKADAARAAGCALLVVERPGQEDGDTMEAIQKRLSEWEARV